MQDGASAYTAKLSQNRCQRNFPRFLEKHQWPGNSPDLNPIEYLCLILKDKLEKLVQATTVKSLEKSENPWSNIPDDILDQLV